MRRVAVTGIGVACPLGCNPRDVLNNAMAGRSAVQLLDMRFADQHFTALAATCEFNASEHFTAPQLRTLDRVSQFALFAANQAIANSRADLSDGNASSRRGVFLGTGSGGTQSTDEGYRMLYATKPMRVKPSTVVLGMHNAPTAWVALQHAITGPSLTYSTACSSSAVAIGEAWLRVASGVVDLAIAGGAEAPLSFGSLKAWEAMHTVATVDPEDPAASCKPFALDRSGMVLGEGAAIVVLEPWDQAVVRDAPIYGEILGYGLVTDATHITRPSVNGQAQAMQAALSSAAIDPSTVDAINAHGTGTPINDAVETEAIKVVFGARAPQIPISASKAMHGHLLGGAGALECVLSLLAMQHEVALPTINLRVADPACDLDYVPNKVRRGVAIKTMLSNSFAFGGTNAVLVLRSASVGA